MALVVKTLPANAGDIRDVGLIPGLGSSGEGTGYPLQYSCLENSMDRGPWQATVHGMAKSRTQLSDFHSLRIFQFVVIHTVKGFSIVNEAEVDVFLEFSWFFYESTDIGKF